jgi:hypothetical protein
MGAALGPLAGCMFEVPDLKYLICNVGKVKVYSLVTILKLFFNCRDLRFETVQIESLNGDRPTFFYNCRDRESW